MSRSYGCIAFTDSVDAEQESYGSAEFFRRLVATRAGSREADSRDAGSREPDARDPDPLGPREAQFLRTRDSFYLSTVGETGWPYVQFRGGPAGFIRVDDEHSFSWADYRGNLQHVSTGNLRTDARVAIIAMDYPTRRRLKIFGTARVVRLEDDPIRVEALRHPDDPDAVVERAVTVTVEAFDWNCPQHITPRYTAAELQDAVAPLRDQIAALEREIVRLRQAAL